MVKIRNINMLGLIFVIWEDVVEGAKGIGLGGIQWSHLVA